MAGVDNAERTTAVRPRPTYARVQAFGLALVGATLLAVSLIAVVTDPGATGEVLGFFGPTAVVMLVAAWLASRFATWAHVVGVVVGLLGAVLLFWTAFGLMAPDSFGDFLLGVGVPVGLLLGIGGGIAAVVARRRGQLEVGPTRGEQRLVRSVLVAIGVALAVSGVTTLLGRGSVDATIAAGATPVEMASFEFVPAEIQVDAADPRLVVTNSDAFLHDLAVPALDAIVRVTPGSTDLLDLSGAAPGRYTVYCTLHSDTGVDDPIEAGMAATLVVR